MLLPAGRRFISFLRAPQVRTLARCALASTMQRQGDGWTGIEGRLVGTRTRGDNQVDVGADIGPTSPRKLALTVRSAATRST